MNLNFPDTPFRLELSFYSIIEALEKTAANTDHPEAARAKTLLEQVASFPELRNGITEEAQLTRSAELIRELLADLFLQH